MKKNRKDHLGARICLITELNFLMTVNRRDFQRQTSNLFNTNLKKKPKRRRTSFLLEGFLEE
jgi:hypothetical protein